MRSLVTSLGVSLASCCLIFATGCGDSTDSVPTVSDDHGSAMTIDAEAEGLNADDLVSIDEPDLPDNYDDAVKQLVQLRDTIRDAFKADDPDAAHNPLHEIGHLLGGIESFVADGEFDAQDKTELTAAVEELFDSYTAVDDTFHSKSGKKYSEVEAQIDAAVKTLQEHVDQ